MSDEFRIHAAVAASDTRRLLEALESIESSAELNAALGRVTVSHDGGDIFLYADDLARARRARSELEEAMTRARVDTQAPVVVQRWHPVEERWEDADAPLPTDAASVEAEQARRDADEDRESAEYGQPEWEVRISLPSRHAAHELADRLQGEGIPVARRSHHLLVGANDEDQARELAERLRAEAPEGAQLEVAGSGRLYWDMLNIPPGPFAIFGGLPH